MKWDIDRTLRLISTPESRVQIGNASANFELVRELGLPTQGLSVDKSVQLFHLSISRSDSKLTKMFWGFTVHDACLRALKFVKTAKAEDLEPIGLLWKARKVNKNARRHIKRQRTTGVEG